MKLTLTFLFFFSISIFIGQTLNIQINSIRSTSGTIRLAFYTHAEAFEKEKPFLIKTIAKTTMKNGRIEVSYKGMSAGTYGIAILDDENSNQKMDYGLVLPKEGFGFSDYYHTGMTRPKFESFQFQLNGADKNIVIKVRYL
jgi:uncharacterized protein (DUF2141 family)